MANFELHKSKTQDNFTTEKVNVVNSGLLGDYVNEEYVIPESIVNELLAMPKHKKSTFKNSVFTTCFLPTHGEVVFEVVYEKNTVNNTAMATLYVLENEYKVNGYIQNTIKTKLNSYVDDLDGFIEKSYKEYNISMNEGGEGKDYKVTDDPALQGYVSAKKQFSNTLSQLTEDKCQNIYKSYFEERLTLIRGLNNPFTKAVLDKFNLEYQKIEKFFLQSKDYKALSELLDKCMEDLYGINPNFKDYEKEYREKMLPVILAFSQQAQNVFNQATSKAITMLKKEDRKKVEEIQEELKHIEEKGKQKETKTPEKTESSKTFDSIMNEIKKIKETKQPEAKKDKEPSPVSTGGSTTTSFTRENAGKDNSNGRKSLEELIKKFETGSKTPEKPIEKNQDNNNIHIVTSENSGNENPALNQMKEPNQRFL